MVTRKLAGWSVRGRPFSPKEFNNSYLKSVLGYSYPTYLSKFASQYKNTKFRKTL